jgi:cytochrome b
MEAMQHHRPVLSDPARAAPAWDRFRRLMRWMALVAVAAVILALVYLRAGGGVLTVHMIIATTAGVGLTVLLGTALMLLVFLSHGTGHDAEAGARHEDER